MQEPRPNSYLAPILSLLCLLCPLIIYTIGYTIAVDHLPSGERIYCFKSRWKCAVYQPAGLFESWITGTPTRMYYETGPFTYLPYDQGPT